jgi:hypothetical protein
MTYNCYIGSFRQTDFQFVIMSGDPQNDTLDDDLLLLL